MAARSHESVNHSANEYVRLGGFVHTNTAENLFSIFKRGIYGVYHHVSEARLHRYLAEFDFRYNNRSKLGIQARHRGRRARRLRGPGRRRQAAPLPGTS